MKTVTISLPHIRRAPALAAALLFCLGITPNTLASATNTAAAVKALSPSQALHGNGEVLSHDDEAKYRALFSAQAQNRWQDADNMASRLQDRRLMGYVLADRYMRRGATLAELQTWLNTYRDLPVADTLYTLARKLPNGRAARLAQPVGSGDISSGSLDYETSSGFRDRDGLVGKAVSPASRRAIIRIQSSLRQGSPAKAKILLEAALQEGLLTQGALIPLQSRLAASYFYNGDTAEARRLTAAGYMQQDPRALWIQGLSQFQSGDADDAAHAFSTLANLPDISDADRAAAAFWAYRALEKDDEHRDARRWLAEAAGLPHTFYGLLASNLSGHDAKREWSWGLPEFSHRASEILAAVPAGARALALVQIGQNEWAEAELRRINPQGHRALQDAMLALAEKANMAELTLKLGGLATSDKGRRYDAALYPLPAWQPRDGYRIDRALMFALMRHESHFDPGAVSNQGACGLMQIMPSTAAHLGVHTGHGCTAQLMDPSLNLMLGQTYVRQLADQSMIGDNLMLLLAAYNGGPGRLSQRAGTEAKDDPLLFMESLPAQETHDYVQQVMMQYWAYRARLNQPLTSIAQLAHGEWPHFALHDTTGAVREAANTVTDTLAMRSATIH